MNCQQDYCVKSIDFKWVQTYKKNQNMNSVLFSIKHNRPLILVLKYLKAQFRIRHVIHIREKKVWICEKQQGYTAFPSRIAHTEYGYSIDSGRPVENNYCCGSARVTSYFLFKYNIIVNKMTITTKVTH